MQNFYNKPASRMTEPYSQSCKYYFSNYEETYQDDLVLISGVIRERFKDFTDCELWKICFGGLRLERFEVTRHGLRVEIMGKMRNLKEIREDIEEDKKKGIRI